MENLIQELEFVIQGFNVPRTEVNAGMLDSVAGVVGKLQILKDQLEINALDAAQIKSALLSAKADLDASDTGHPFASIAKDDLVRFADAV
jgi:hypothetical protein